MKNLKAKTFDTQQTLMIKQVAKGGGISFFSTIVSGVANFALVILLARFLGAKLYGISTLGRTICAIVQSIASLGLPQGVVKFCSMYRAQRGFGQIKGTIASALIISSILSILLASSLFFLSDLIALNLFQKPQLGWVLRVLSIALLFYVFMAIFASFAQSFGLIGYYEGINNLFHPLTTFLVISLLFFLGFKLSAAVLGFVISAFLSAVLGFYFMKRIFSQYIPRGKAKIEYNFRKLLRFSVPMFSIGISHFLLTYTDRAMLGYFRPAEEVGIYNAAAVTSMKLMIFMSSFIPIFSPLVSDLYTRAKHEEMQELLTIVTKWSLTLTLPFFIVLIIFSKEIMGIFGPEFKGGWQVLLILGSAYFIIVGTGPLTPVLQMTGKQDIEMVNSLSLLIINIGLNLLLIPAYGMIGGAIATSISLILIKLLRLYQVNRMLRLIPYTRQIIKPLLAGIFSLITCLGFKGISLQDQSYIWFIGGAILSLIVYIIVLFLIRFDPEDKIVFSAIKSKILGQS